MLTARSFHLRLSSELLLLTSRSEEHTSELQSRSDLVCRLLLEKKNIVNSGMVYTNRIVTSLTMVWIDRDNHVSLSSFISRLIGTTGRIGINPILLQTYYPIKA